MKQTDEARQIVIVIERFTCTHDHNVINPLSSILFGSQKLTANFSRCQVTNQSVHAGCTELAAHATSRL